MRLFNFWHEWAPEGCFSWIKCWLILPVLHDHECAKIARDGVKHRRLLCDADTPVSQAQRRADGAMAPYSECIWFDYLGPYVDRKSFWDNYRKHLHLLSLRLREIWSVSVYGSQFWDAQHWIRDGGGIWVLHFVLPKSCPSFCEQVVVIIAGAIRVMRRSMSEIELLCRGCWGMQGSAASHFYLLKLIQHCPFKMWSCRWAELSEVCSARWTSVLRSTINNHETVASVKLRALLSRLMKKSIRNKSVMTELQSADLNTPTARISPRPTPYRRVESGASLWVKCAYPEIWSCPSSALVLVSGYIWPYLTHLIHLGVKTCSRAPPSVKDILGKRGDVWSVSIILWEKPEPGVITKTLPIHYNCRMREH